jgi:hypothetical protein
MSAGRDKGKGRMTLSEIEARKERENKERRRFRLQEAKEKIFPETRKRRAPEESESEDGESEEEPGFPVARGSWRASGAGPAVSRPATDVAGSENPAGSMGSDTEHLARKRRESSQSQRKRLGGPKHLRRQTTPRRREGPTGMEIGSGAEFPRPGLCRRGLQLI